VAAEIDFVPPYTHLQPSRVHNVQDTTEKWQYSLQVQL
jgi:hypothetical protein